MVARLSRAGTALADNGYGLLNRTGPGRAMATRLLRILVALAFVAGCSRGAEEQQRVHAALRQALTGQARPAYVTADAEGGKLWKLTKQFYERRQFTPAWIDGTDPRPQMGELIATLHEAHREGLDPQLYNVTLLDQRRQEAQKGFLNKKGFDPAEAGSLDVWLTYLYLKYASDLADGLSDLAHADPKWQIRPEKFDPAGRLEEALQNNRVQDSLLDLAPENPHYKALRTSLEQYKAMKANGGWPAVPPGL